MTRINLISILIPVSLTIGCAASLIGGSPTKIELTGLENVQKKIGVYFDKTTAVYQGADATLKAMTAAQSEFKLSSEDYRALMIAISAGTPFATPASLDDEQTARLSTLVTNGQRLTSAVRDASKQTTEASEFLVQQASQIEEELLTIKRDYEVIKRNPLASRRDKGRAANQVRKANKLAQSIKDDGQKQLKTFSTLQANATKTVGEWTLSLDPALLKQAINNQPPPLVGEQLDNIEVKTKTLNETVHSEIKRTVDDGRPTGQKALNKIKPSPMGENEGLKTLNRKASAKIKEGTTKGSRSVDKIEEATQRGVKKAGDSLIEAPSKIETLDDDNSK